MTVVIPGENTHVILSQQKQGRDKQIKKSLCG